MLKSRSFLLVLVLLLISNVVSRRSAAQDTLYSRAYGDPTRPVILYLHDGPGKNAVSFEYSTAQPLADRGYYVIVFDQRASGRSSETKGKFTFDAASADIDSILSKYHVSRTTILGHDFGGILGMEYAKRHPQMVERLILLNTPLSYPALFSTILKNCRNVYTAKKSTQLRYIDYLDTANRKTDVFVTLCMQHAEHAGLLAPRSETAQSKSLRNSLRGSPWAMYLKGSSVIAMSGFFQNEHYSTTDYTSLLKTVVKKTPVDMICGIEDGMFNEAELKKVETIVHGDHFSRLFHSGYYAYLDEQPEFLDLISAIEKKLVK